MKYLKLYNESFNYDDYTKELSKDEFFDIYKKYCNEFDLDNPFLLRGIKKDSDYLYINIKYHNTFRQIKNATPGDKSHILAKRFHYELTKTDLWEGYPPKGDSLDFSNYEMNQYGTSYYIIPFNGARFAIMKGLFSFSWNYLTKELLRDNKYSEYDYVSPSMVLGEIIGRYEHITGKKFNINNIYECFKIMDKYVRENKTYNYLSYIRIKMDIDKSTFGEAIIDLFNPKKNDIKLYDLKGLKNIDYKYVGWTDSKVLMINKELYDENYKTH